MGYLMFAYVSNGGLTGNVTLTSICNNQIEINEQTSPSRGPINASTAFVKANTVNFTGKHQWEVVYDG